MFEHARDALAVYFRRMDLGATAATHAAANASLPTIRLLLEAGANPQESDSKGLRAVHYLLGLGPAPANPRLSAEDLAEATRLLY